MRKQKAFTPLEIRIADEQDRRFLTGPVRKALSDGAGFTLIELLVVISIISLLTAILVPLLGKVRCQARAVAGMSNMRQIAGAANYYALDNGDAYPPSVATIGLADHWNWQEPTMLTGYRKRSPQLHRSMSAYMRPYVENATVMFCPNAPKKYRYLQEAWDAGDEWDNPETAPVPDPVIGVYCLYWNYVGYLGPKRGLFRGPSSPSGGWDQSRLLVTCYFGYGHHRSPDSYGSCQRFKGASITEGTLLSSAYWSRKTAAGSAVPDIKLCAGYTDGHVENYSSSDTVTMRVIWKPETGEPYPHGLGPGNFHLPPNALR